MTNLSREFDEHASARLVRDLEHLVKRFTSKGYGPAQTRFNLALMLLGWLIINKVTTAKSLHGG